MSRVLYDTNVLLDVLLERKPHLNASAAALDLAASDRVEGFIAGHTVTTLAYLLQRERGAKVAHEALTHLLSRLKVAATTDAGVREALEMDLGDFEDAVCVAAALEARCDSIVTRNVRHFRGAKVPALLPEAVLSALAELLKDPT
jgi:predicted nucleic acid-binding protein